MVFWKENKLDKFYFSFLTVNSVYIVLQRFDGTGTKFSECPKKRLQRVSKLGRKKKKRLEILKNICQKNVNFHSSLEKGKL